MTWQAAAIMTESIYGVCILVVVKVQDHEEQCCKGGVVPTMYVWTFWTLNGGGVTRIKKKDTLCIPLGPDANAAVRVVGLSQACLDQDVSL